MWNQVITLYTKNIQYLLVEEQLFTPELGSYRTFGIAALRRSPRGSEQLAYVSDVSTDRPFAAGLAERCRRGGLSPVHLPDFIADALGL